MDVSVDAQRALIFRISHKDNVPNILDSSLVCGSDATTTSYTNIGNTEFIAKRKLHNVPIAPGGTLSNYIPFYFTYASPMLYCINKGYGVPRRQNREIVFLVTSLHHFINQNIKFVFTDRHAYLTAAQFFNDLSYLDRIDWDILQRKDFKRDPEDPEKHERYMAESLAHKEVPLSRLLGLACYN